MNVPDLGKIRPIRPEEPTEEEPVEQEAFLVGPCEGLFNQMLAEMDAQIRRANIANPAARPQLNMMMMLRSMMRAVDSVMSVSMGQVDELRDQFTSHGHGDGKVT